LVWWIVLAGFAWLGFAYAGYPLLLAALRAVSPRPITRGDVTLSLSVIIAAHNGAAELRRKLESVLDQDYTGPVEVIVSSDGSTDTTVEVARSFESAGVQVIDAPQRAGKEAAQGRGIALAKGEVLVMTDVAGELAPDALRQIVRPFADPSVGCVSSEDEVSDAGGEGAYVRYEMALRRLESETTSLVGASGSLFAFRRELAADWRDDLANCGPSASLPPGRASLPRTMWRPSGTGKCARSAAAWPFCPPTAMCCTRATDAPRSRSGGTK
jgi:cellulose synthase/poly-beta-1,6-N-acetylglucosamine synthase-like glycosyltransferase